MKRLLALVALALCAAGCGSGSDAAPVAPVGTSGRPTTGPDLMVARNVDTPYELGTFVGTDIWVDPQDGDDGRDGHDRASAMRTVDAAWQRVPAGVVLTTGYRLRLVRGVYPQETSVNYWEDRHGTATAPIVVEAADGAHTATFEGDINMFDVSHFALLGVDIIREGDAFHCEACDHILIRGSELNGGSGAHETVKINQSQYVYIEASDIHGADDNAIDFVAVQYGHVRGNRIHDAQDWCAYAKGGSAYITFSANEVYDCGTGGITAGQGTGFEFMAAPWLNYEAYGIVIVDNVVHDTDGAGLGVAGGFNIVLAYNTLYSVGSRSHVIEVVHGRRGCDGTADVCSEHHDLGGWGSTEGEEALIPNRHVYVYDNLVINPAAHQSQWQQFQVDGPLDVPATSGVESPSLADDDLRIAGNVIWNGPLDHPLGTGEGCSDANPSCNEDQLRRDNSINSIEAELRDPAAGDYGLTAESAATLPPAVGIPDLIWDDTPLPIPAGATEVQVPTDFFGTSRTAVGPPGAG